MVADRARCARELIETLKKHDLVWSEPVEEYLDAIPPLKLR